MGGGLPPMPISFSVYEVVPPSRAVVLLSDAMLYLRWLGGMVFVAALWWMFGGGR